MLARLPSYPAAAQRLADAARPAGVPAPARPPRARRRRPRAARLRAAGVPRRGVGRRDRLRLRRRALPRRLRRARGGRLRRLRALGRDHARRGARDRVRRGGARRRARARARDHARRRARPALSDDPHATVAVLALETEPATAARSRPPAAGCGACRPRCGCGTTPSPRSARPPGRAPTAARGWRSRSPPACAARAGDCLLAAEEEDPLRAFCGLVARRTPRAGELAWALRRFELGCERGSAVEALTDWLLAARALFADVDAPATSGVAERLAAICAEPARPRRGSRPRVTRGDLARARRDGRLRAPDARGRRARRASSAAACARSCATCSAATSTRAAAVADELVAEQV